MLEGATMQSASGHAFVFGSGIAGLSLAEILSRNGWQITLLETASELGGDASRSTQNWLHTGWLYAGLPYASAMQGCAASVRLFRKTYDAVLPPEIVNIVADGRGVEYPDSSEGWFHSERVLFAYAVATRDLSVVERATWNAYLETIPLRRLRRLGYATAALREVPRPFLELMNYWEGAEDGHAKYRVIPSTDARIETRRVLSSLLGMLGERTRVITRARYELERSGDRTIVRIDGEVHRPDLCILAAGRSVPMLVARLGAERLARDFKSVSSPIVVLRRALDLPNFIRYTPNLPETVNHIKYPVDGRCVSTIGSYDFHPPDAPVDTRPFVEKVCRRLAIETSEVVGCYFGTKTELTGALERRYNHAVGPVNANTYFAIAGKFSQFPLLVNDFAIKCGLRVDLANDARGTLALSVASTAPERLVRAAEPKPYAA
jgi:glycine/D-amino acid oxidase-like deaminating enzyme